MACRKQIREAKVRWYCRNLSQRVPKVLGVSILRFNQDFDVR